MNITVFWGGWIFQSPCDFKNWLAAQFSDLDGGKIKPGVGGSLFPRAYTLLVVVVVVMRHICSFYVFVVLNNLIRTITMAE